MLLSSVLVLCLSLCPALSSPASARRAGLRTGLLTGLLTGTLAAQVQGAKAINQHIQAEYPRAKPLKPKDLQVVRRGRTQVSTGGTSSSWALVTKKLTHALEPAVVVVQVKRLDRRHWKGLRATRVGFIRSR